MTTYYSIEDNKVQVFGASPEVHATLVTAGIVFVAASDPRVVAHLSAETSVRAALVTTDTTRSTAIAAIADAANLTVAQTEALFG